MLMRRYREALLEIWHGHPVLEGKGDEEKHEIIFRGFQKSQVRCRELLAKYRACTTFNMPFKLAPYVEQTLICPVLGSNIPTARLFLREVSLVFSIPGWESFSVEEVAKLRISEEPITKEMISGFEWGMAGTQYLEDMRRREAEMSGKKEVSVETLEDWLKGDA
jgi:hypothetical protein